MLYQGIGIKFATKKTETVPDEFYIWDRESSEFCFGGWSGLLLYFKQHINSCHDDGTNA